MLTPQAATSGARIRLTFSSPVPPEECFSISVRGGRPVPDQSVTPPLSRIASVSAAVSAGVIPC